MSEKIRFAVVGCGHIGKRHAEMISRNGECELVALVDVKPEAELGLTQYGVPFFSSLDQLLCSYVNVDVITVATPNGLHYKQALQILESGRHVVVEKPVTLNRDEAAQLINVAKERDRRLFLVMQNRYSPPAVWLKEMISSGKLGQLFMIQLNCYWNRDERYYTPGSWRGTKNLDGGTLFTQFSHFIDIMYWLFGDVNFIDSWMADFNHSHLTEFEDSGMIRFKFENGAVGCLNFSTSVWNRNLESSLTVIAENGSVKIGGQYMDKVEVCHIKDYDMPELAPTGPENDYGSYKGSALNHHFIFENIVEALRGHSQPAMDPTDGLKVIDLIGRIYEAAGNAPYTRDHLLDLKASINAQQDKPVIK